MKILFQQKEKREEEKLIQTFTNPQDQKVMPAGDGAFPLRGRGLSKSGSLSRPAWEPPRFSEQSGSDLPPVRTPGLWVRSVIALAPAEILDQAGWSESLAPDLAPRITRSQLREQAIPLIIYIYAYSS